jgi:hypothetical protein
VMGEPCWIESFVTTAICCPGIERPRARMSGPTAAGFVAERTARYPGSLSR